MVRQKRTRLIQLFLPIALAGLACMPAPVQAQKVRKDVIEFEPPTINLTADPAAITVCEGRAESNVVRLNANAVSPGGYPIRYQWRTSAGRINGTGGVVSWDLSGVAPGYYKAFVDIDTGSGDELCQAFATTTVLVRKCPPPAPVCPSVTVSCPERQVVGEPLEFNATVTGGSPDVGRIYNWTVSAGTIIAGQGTNSIRVDTTGLAGQSVRATLSMGGYPMDCSATCLVQFPPPLECRKFDEFPDISRNDEKARLDNYAIEMQNDPSANAYVIVYPGERGRPGDVQRHTTRIVDYLINSRGLDSRRIITLIGPARADLMVELWVCPPGAKAPTPIP